VNLIKSQSAAFALLFFSGLFPLTGIGQEYPETEPAATNAENTNSAALNTNSMSVLPLEDLQIFTKAFDHIRKSYVREIDDRTLLEYAIRGMLDELDPHSSYLDASSYEDLQVNTTGEFGGLGIEVGIEDGFIKVISPIDGTPAEKAGIESRDLIIKLDGMSAKGLSLDEAVDKMRGPKGSKITLTVVREGVDQPFELVLTRDIIKVKSVRSELKESKFAYLRIAQFQVHTGKDLDQAYAKMVKKTPGISGVILDLRNNPGGVLQASVEVADHFLEGGKIVYTEGRTPGSNTQYLASPGDMTGGLPLIVLVNDGSASASEIVAGALQDQGRAIVLGTKSFGKGSVQSIIPVSNDKALKLTTALYYTPKGRSIQAEGIVPDIEVERVRVTAVSPRSSISESGLSGHLEIPDNTKKGKKESTKDDVEEATSQQNTDSQLYEAINLLKGLALFKQQQGAAKEQASPETIGE
jgi:carboxyl-terminal processing protease